MAEVIGELIEPAEETEDTGKLLEIIATCTKQSGDEDWEEPTEAALDAYYRLTKGSAKNSNSDEGTAMSVICSCLNAWQAEEAIVEVGLGIMGTLSKHLTEEEKAGSHTTSAVDTAALIVTLMKAYPDEGTIQEQACLAVEGLAAASLKWKESFLSTAGIQEELSAAVNRITNERNKSYPARAASILGVDL